jgi:hypothetical protein
MMRYGFVHWLFKFIPDTVIRFKSGGFGGDYFNLTNSSAVSLISEYSEFKNAYI